MSFKLVYSILIILLISSTTAFSQNELLSSRKLKKQKVYTNLDEARINPEEVYRLSLAGDTEGEILKSLPEEVFKFPNLQELNISNNKIKELPLKLYKLKYLQILDISFNPITELPSEISGLKNLKKLNARFCRLSNFPIEISEIKTLEEIDFFGNHIEELPGKFRGSQSIKSLNILRNGMNNESKERLKELFPNAKFDKEKKK